MKKQLIARLLVFVMLFQLGGTAFASQEIEEIQDSATETMAQEETQIDEESATSATAVGSLSMSGGTLGTDFSYESHVLTILKAGTYTISGTSTTDRIVVAENVTAVNLIFSNASIDAPSTASTHALEISAGAEVNLSGTGTVTGTGAKSNGILNNGTLNITSGTIKSNSMQQHGIVNYGTMTISGDSTAVQGTTEGSGTILGFQNAPDATLNMQGGTLTISGVYGLKNYGNLNFSGGNTTVTATTTGIASEKYGSTPSFTVTGGNLTVTGNAAFTFSTSTPEMVVADNINVSAGASSSATLTNIEASKSILVTYNYVKFSDGSDGSTTDPEEPTTPDPEEPTTPDPEEPTTPDPEEPTTPDPEEPTTPDPEEPTTPDPEEPTTPDPEEPTTPDPDDSTEDSGSADSWFVFSSGTITGLQGDGLTATEIVIPSSINGVAVTAIGANAFANQTKLESLTISGAVKSIGASAYSGCTALATLSLPDTIQTVGYRAFYNCPFTEITFSQVSSSVISSISLDKTAFYYNISSKTITLHCTEKNKTVWTTASTPFNSSYLGDRGLVKLEVYAVATTTPEPEPVTAVSVSGKVFDNSGSPLENVKMELIQTGKIIEEGETDENGAYSFSDIPVGMYNLVATSDSASKTELLNLTTDSTQDVTMPSDNVSSQVVIPEIIPVVAVGNVDSVAEDEAENEGEKVAVTMEVSATVATDTQEEINGGLLGDEIVGIWLDITLTKTVGDDTTEIPITETNSLLEIVFQLTEDLQKLGGYAVYREHEGVVDKIYTTANADGEYIKVEGDYLILYVKKFSVYALAVSQNPITDPSIGGNTGGSSPSLPENDSSTEDEESNDSSSGSSSSGSSSSCSSSSGSSSSGSSTSGSSSSGSSSSGNSSTEEETTEDSTEKIPLPIYHNMTLNTFSDLNDSRVWYYEAVKYVYDRGLMTGTGEDTFAPAQETSRGMVVTILHKLAGNPSGFAATFEDVSPNAYYAEAVAWANAVGIATGEEATLFNPDGGMTREELVLVLYRYEERFGQVEQATDLPFQDVADMSHWAKEAIAWSAELGLITGKDDNLFAPQDKGNRGELAQILVKYLQYRP